MHVEFFSGFAPSAHFGPECVDSFYVPSGVYVENGDIVGRGGQDWLVYTDSMPWATAKRFFSNEWIRVINLNCINVFATDVKLDHPRVQRTGNGPAGTHMYKVNEILVS